MGDISTHPSLHTLNLRIEEERVFSHVSAQQGRIEALADMLLANQRMDEIPFDYSTFDPALWDALVVPRLESNLYRKRFVPIRAIQEASTRAAVVARALDRVASISCRTVASTGPRRLRHKLAAVIPYKYSPETLMIKTF
jgi:hypothetical protein